MLGIYRELVKVARVSEAITSLSKYGINVNVEEAEKETAKLYKKYYSIEQAQAMLDYYKSAAGQKEIEVGPKLNKDIAQLATRMVQGKENPFAKIFTRRK